MNLRLSMVTIDTTDADALAEWWAQQIGGEIVERNDGWYVMVAGGALPVRLAFQRVEDPTPGKNRVHLELVAGEHLEAEVDRLVAAGATLVARRGDESFRWVTLADPDGNVFCVAQPDAH